MPTDMPTDANNDTQADLTGEPPIGRHLLADLHDADIVVLCDLELIEAALIAAAKVAGATPVGQNFHHFGPGLGITGVVLLSESHISIHTWPERRFAALDVFMCGATQPEIAVDCVAAALRAKRVETKVVMRG
jgi:S-adenosylmethionine decarboxylase